MRFSAVIHAPVNDRFMPGCMDNLVGKPVTLKSHGDGGSYSGDLIDYEVIEDGVAVKVTIDLPEAHE